MGRNRAFIVPVCVDDTPDAEADVPDSFSAAQWTRLPAGVSGPAFIDRIARLLSPEDMAAAAPSRPQAIATRVVEPAVREADRMPARSWRSRGALVLVAAVAVFVVGYLIAVRYALPKHVIREAVPANPAVYDAAVVSATNGAVPEKSIAVLPFRGPEREEGPGIFLRRSVEELIDLLTKVPDLRVPARTSSFFFKGKTDDIATIAAKLRVAQLLEGSVRKAGNTIRVTAQLVRADNGYHLWSETYDRDLKDVFKVQDEIAGAVVAALKLKLAPGPQASSSHRTSNTEAYNQFLLGRQFLERGES